MGRGRPAKTDGVDALRESIRIRFTYEGRRRSLTVALPPTKANLAAARKMRRKIAAEIEAGVFDPETYFPSETSSNGVPLFEAPPLARALHRSVDIGAEVPSSLYVAVAQVLSYVFQLRVARRAGMPAPPRPVVKVEE